MWGFPSSRLGRAAVSELVVGKVDAECTDSRLSRAAMSELVVDKVDAECIDIVSASSGRDSFALSVGSK